jgi:hypothetical protein
LARTIDVNVEEAEDTMPRLGAVGVDMDDVGLALETDGVASFHNPSEKCSPRSTPRPGSPRDTESDDLDQGGGRTALRFDSTMLRLRS